MAEITKRKIKSLKLIKAIKEKTKELKDAIKRDKQKKAPFKVLICVVKKKIGHDVRIYLGEQGFNIQLVQYSYDYNQSPVKNMLALSDVEQEIIISLVDTKKIKGLINDLSKKFDLTEDTTNGFACLVPPSSATLESLKIIVKNYKKQNLIKLGDINMKEKQYDLVLSITSTDHSQEVINVAKGLGVNSATFLKGRGTGSYETQTFMKMEIQPEKEIIMMVVPKEIRRKLMQEIALVAGINTEANGFCFSMPVEAWTGTIPKVVIPKEIKEEIESEKQISQIENELKSTDDKTIDKSETVDDEKLKNNTIKNDKEKSDASNVVDDNKQSLSETKSNEIKKSKSKTSSQKENNPTIKKEKNATRKDDKIIDSDTNNQEKSKKMKKDEKISKNNEKITKKDK